MRSIRLRSSYGGQVRLRYVCAAAEATDKSASATLRRNKSVSARLRRDKDDRAPEKVTHDSGGRGKIDVPKAGSMVTWPQVKASVEAMDGERASLSSTRVFALPGAAGAFSLTELLVVMVMIAIMAALMLPALSKAKRQVSASTCLNNQKRLAYAFHLYAQDNSDRIVQMADYRTGADVWPAGGFWGGPVTTPESWNGPSDALYAVQTGLKSSNAFYFYCSTLEAYHCPGDLRMRNNPTCVSPNGWAFDSYARSQNLGGDPYDDYWGAGATYTKMSGIATPGTTFAMIEDADWRGYNLGTWAVNWTGDSFAWQNPLAFWHINVDSIAFADGHAELRKWTDPALIAAGQAAACGRPELSWEGPTNGADYLFVYKGYQFPGHP
jgi:type II secretory pathway pseudopilin PulG